jgi:hypothetical protein
MSESQKTAEDKAYLWKWGVVIALVALSVSVGLNIYDRLSKPIGLRIAAEAKYSSFSLPTSVQNLIAPHATVKETEKPSENQLPTEWEWLSRYVEINLRNVGDSDAKKVSLVLGGSGYASVDSLDGTKVTGELRYRDEIEVGRLRRDKAIQIRVWPDARGMRDTVLVLYDDKQTTAPIANTPYLAPSYWSVLLQYVELAVILLAAIAAVRIVDLILRHRAKKPKHPLQAAELPKESKAVS